MYLERYLGVHRRKMNGKVESFNEEQKELSKDINENM